MAAMVNFQYEKKEIALDKIQNIDKTSNILV